MTQRIRDVMTRAVEVVRPGDTLRDAAEKMRGLNVGALPVCEGPRVVGMLTDRDIVVRAIALGMDSAQTTVEEAMTAHVQFCAEEDTVQQVLERMRDLQVRRFLVVDEDEHLLGIVALGDLVTLENEQHVGEALAGISASPHPAF